MLRNLLFAPGSDARKLRHALGFDADAAVADLEDAVAPGEKDAARETVAELFGLNEPYAERTRFGRLRCDAPEAAQFFPGPEAEGTVE